MGKKTTRKNIFGNGIIKNLLLIIASGAALIIFTLLFLNVYTRHGQNVVVPDLEGLQVKEAKKILRSKGLHAEVVDSIYQRSAVPGAIIAQTPKPNNKVKEGRAIYITVYSQNPQQIAVPSLVDYSERQAVALLNSMGFTQLSIENVPSEYAGLVMAVQFRGRTLTSEEKIPAGSPLKLVVGSGMQDDSLNVNREYVVSPAQTNVPENSETGIDDTFF